MTTKVAVAAYPPVDMDGEFKRAGLALSRCRRELDNANLPEAWQRWVIDSLVATATLTPDEHTNQE